MNSAEESHQIDEVKSRLSAKFSSVDASNIEDSVAAEVARFESGSIRDFVPLLVERAATRRLAAN